MAEGWDESRTEAPTPRRREEAREQGQVAVSSDLSSSLVLLAGLTALAMTAGTVAAALRSRVADGLLRAGKTTHLNLEEGTALLAGQVGGGLELLGLLLGLVFVVAAAAGALQVGFRLTPQAAALKWERLSPVRGWAKLFSAAAAWRALFATLKIAVVLAAALWILRSRIGAIRSSPQLTLAPMVALAWDIALNLALVCAGAMVLLGMADYFWQWWRLERSLRMTKQELKEELKREDGNPQVKGRVRKLQREAAQKRMMRDVAGATVVVTNPTHLAVALRYDRQSMGAPRVVAKGAGFVAARIVQLARRHAVPVLERKPVAQALFKTVEVGREIPAALYHVVAEVLAFVYRQRAG